MLNKLREIGFSLNPNRHRIKRQDVARNRNLIGRIDASERVRNMRGVTPPPSVRAVLREPVQSVEVRWEQDPNLIGETGRVIVTGTDGRNRQRTLLQVPVGIHDNPHLSDALLRDGVNFHIVSGALTQEHVDHIVQVYGQAPRDVQVRREMADYAVAKRPQRVQHSIGRDYVLPVARAVSDVAERVRQRFSKGR